MGLSEPVSGSHVATAPVPVPLFPNLPPHCTPFPPRSDPISSSLVNPSSFPPLPPSSVPSSDPSPASAPAPTSGADPPPVAFPRPDLAPDHCSAANPLLVPSFQASATPSSSRSVPPSPNSSSAGHPCSSVGPAPASHGPIVDPTDHRVVPPDPNLPCHPSSSQILSAPLPSASIPPPILSSLPRPLTSGRSSGVAPPLSYAQAARGPRGPGFVRSHAADVESFARLPRTGINIICGSREGAPSFSFVSSDLPKVEEIYSNALVMRFLGGRPSLEASHKEILNWGIEKPFSIGPMSSRAFLLRFQDSKDLVRVLSRPSSILITFPYRVFRWHNRCHIKEDSCFAPVWISLPKLPLQCFIPEFLESVANKIGRFLCFDKATATLARPSAARMCVELDLRKIPPPFIWVGLFEGLKQAIIYERMPKFCSQCLSQGHVVSVCPWGHRETLPTQAHPRPDPGLGRPPTARRNASRRSSSNSHINSSSASFNSSHTPHPQNSTAPITLTEPPLSKYPPPSVAEIRPPAHPPSTQASADPPFVLNHNSQPPHTHSPHSEEQLHPVLPQPSLGNCSEQGQCPGSSSTLSATLSSSLPKASRASQLSSAAPPFPHPVDSAQVPPPIAAEPQLASPTKSKTKNRKIKAKKKSVSFKLPGQSNLSANVDFWSAVNNHITNTTSVPPSTCPSDNQKRIIAAFDTGKIHPALWEAVNRQASILDQARLTGSPVVQSLLNSSRATVPNPPVSIPSSSNTNLYTMSPSTSDSESSIAADSPPYSPTHIPHGSQYDVFSLKPSSYKSEGEDSGTEEVRFQGHFSDDMSSAKPKSSRKNKRHPDQPLNVQLRARKGGGY